MKTKNCHNCGRVFEKTDKCRGKNWEKRKYCSQECARKHIIPWNKETNIQLNTGKTHIKKGQRLSPKTEFVKGQIPWNKGKIDPSKNNRNNSNHKEWRLSVLERDNYKCVECGVDAKIAHHIKNFKKYPELRYDVDNGKTLCSKCHGKFHRQEQLNK